MAFRIKSKYAFKASLLENGNWSNQVPELSLSKSDDIFISNKINNINSPIYVQPDRIQFCNIFNVIEQNITFSWYVDHAEISKTFSIQKGRYSSNQLEQILNEFDDRIKFQFTPFNKNAISGSLTVENLTDEFDIIIDMNRNLVLTTGLIDIYNLLGMNETYVKIPCQRKFKITSNYDMSRTIKQIKLYSKYIFDYKTELCYKVFSSNELNCLNNKNDFFDNGIQSSNLQAKVQKVDRFDMQSCKFYFLDFFDELVYFDFCELVIFISNK